MFATAMSGNAIAAVALIGFLGVAHSYLGEKYLLARLLKQNLPRLSRDRDDAFTKQVLRFAWHLTTVAWFGLGLIVWVEPTARISHTVGSIFLVHVPFPLVWTKGRHLSWVIFLAIGILLWI